MITKAHPELFSGELKTITQVSLKNNCILKKKSLVVKCSLKLQVFAYIHSKA